jgi:L-threonylcarbamoyladenylate synthase
MGAVEDAIEALRRGEPVVLPTDTVYGLCASPDEEAAVRALARLKGRDEAKPIALVAADIGQLLDRIPELAGRAEAIAGALLPGPYTLILPNPARRLRWLNTAKPDVIGVRVPVLPEPARRVVETIGPVAATSANLAGERDPRTVADIPEALLKRVAAVVDAGPLRGVPSTVIDCSGPKPVVVREGAVPAAEALARLAGGREQ